NFAAIGVPRFGGHKLFSKLLATRTSNHFCSPILTYIPKMSLQIVDSSLLRMMAVEDSQAVARQLTTEAPNRDNNVVRLMA
ncbi:unnamed protein product, partial [Musa hybrid cultivar]